MILLYILARGPVQSPGSAPGFCPLRCFERLKSPRFIRAQHLNYILAFSQVKGNPHLNLVTLGSWLQLKFRMLVNCI